MAAAKGFVDRLGLLADIAPDTLVHLIERTAAKAGGEDIFAVPKPPAIAGATDIEVQRVANVCYRAAVVVNTA